VANRASSFDPYELLGVLQQRHVSFVVVGAFARIIHGTGEVTDGLDITPSMRDDNLARLQKALADLEADRVDRKPLDLADVREPVIDLSTRVGELKLVPEPLGRSLRPQVASPGDLARMLGALDRDDQLPTLLRLRRLIDLERELGRTRGIEL
jgi:hypothetical protein